MIKKHAVLMGFLALSFTPVQATEYFTCDGPNSDQFNSEDFNVSTQLKLDVKIPGKTDRLGLPLKETKSYVSKVRGTTVAGTGLPSIEANASAHEFLYLSHPTNPYSIEIDLDQKPSIFKNIDKVLFTAHLAKGSESFTIPASKVGDLRLVGAYALAVRSSYSISSDQSSVTFYRNRMTCTATVKNYQKLFAINPESGESLKLHSLRIQMSEQINEILDAHQPESNLSAGEVQLESRYGTYNSKKIFMVASDMSDLKSNEGQTCSLGTGSLISILASKTNLLENEIFTDGETDGNNQLVQKIKVLVVSSKIQDCKAGWVATIKLSDLIEMEAKFKAKISKNND